MSARSVVVKLLDRPGFRPVLAGLASRYASHVSGKSGVNASLRVFYDVPTGCWGRAYGQDRLVEAPQFPYYADHLQPESGKSPWYSQALQYWMKYADVPPGGTVLDIGAEIGSDSLAFGERVGPAGKVFAVEAHPITYTRLYRTVLLSGCRQIVPICAAVWDAPGIASIEDGESSLDASLVTQNRTVTNRPVHTVSAITVDALCDGFEGNIDLIKMNIEGAERRALGGMQKTLARARNIVVACHDFRADAGDGEWFRTKAIVTEVLMKAGFEILPNPYEPGTGHIYVRDFVYARHPTLG